MVISIRYRIFVNIAPNIRLKCPWSLKTLSRCVATLASTSKSGWVPMCQTFNCNELTYIPKMSKTIVLISFVSYVQQHLWKMVSIFQDVLQRKLLTAEGESEGSRVRWKRCRSFMLNGGPKTIGCRKIKLDRPWLGRLIMLITSHVHIMWHTQ